MNKKKIFRDTEYSHLYPKGIKPARLYGTPKTSKAFLSGSLSPFQPIVSSVVTYNHNLAQYLGSLLSPYIPSNYSTHLKYTRLSYQVLFLLFDLFSFQSLLLTAILFST